MQLEQRLEAACGQEAMSLVVAALTISRIPYGRPSRLTAAGVLDDWRGTCSTKHALLAQVVGEAWPEAEPKLWHRVYTITRGLAEAYWGPAVAGRVPSSGLVDVHTYATLLIGARNVRVDVTFALASWDGVSDVPLACGDGVDSPAGDQPIASKVALVAEHCDSARRERFIAALSLVQ